LPHVILRRVVKDAWYKKMLIILISSMVYGFGHLFFGLSLVGLTFLLGILLGMLYEYKRNFWGVCLVHMIIGYLVMTGLGYDFLLQLPK
jgi:membrane protease YdiL (CAAX protease family)